jgi:hypothetical protein
MAHYTMRCAAAVTAHPCGSPALSLQRFIRAPVPLKLLDRLNDLPPDQSAIDIAVAEQFGRALGRADWRILAVLVDQELGGAISSSGRWQNPSGG